MNKWIFVFLALGSLIAGMTGKLESASTIIAVILCVGFAFVIEAIEKSKR